MDNSRLESSSGFYPTTSNKDLMNFLGESQYAQAVPNTYSKEPPQYYNYENKTLVRERDFKTPPVLKNPPSYKSALASRSANSTPIYNGVRPSTLLPPGTPVSSSAYPGPPPSYSSSSPRSSVTSFESRSSGGLSNQGIHSSNTSPASRFTQDGRQYRPVSTGTGVCYAPCVTPLQQVTREIAIEEEKRNLAVTGECDCKTNGNSNIVAVPSSPLASNSLQVNKVTQQPQNYAAFAQPATLLNQSFPSHTQTLTAQTRQVTGWSNPLYEQYSTLDVGDPAIGLGQDPRHIQGHGQELNNFVQSPPTLSNNNLITTNSYLPGRIVNTLRGTTPPYMTASVPNNIVQQNLIPYNHQSTARHSLETTENSRAVDVLTKKLEADLHIATPNSQAINRGRSVSTTPLHRCNSQEDPGAARSKSSLAHNRPPPPPYHGPHQKISPSTECPQSLHRQQIPSAFQPLPDTNPPLPPRMVVTQNGRSSVSSETDEQHISYGICHICEKPVFGALQACQAMDKIYHTNCFVCCLCGRTLRDKYFYNVRGKMYCEEDYLYSGFQQVTEKCAACGHFIMEMMLQGMGKCYHPGCFRCHNCRQGLDGIPFTSAVDGNVYCVQCYHKIYAPKCAICQQAITPIEGTDETVRVVSMEKNYHIDCYRCQDCRCQLTDEEGHQCYPLHDALLCYSCHIRKLQIIRDLSMSNVNKIPIKNRPLPKLPPNNLSVATSIAVQKQVPLHTSNSVPTFSTNSSSKIIVTKNAAIVRAATEHKTLPM